MRLATIACLLAACAFAQSKPAEYHSASDIRQAFHKLAEQAKSKNAGSSGATLGTYSNHTLQLSYRRENGGAEVHVHLTDVMMVVAGSATIITGGSLVEPRQESESEIRGQSIEGGTKQVLSAGDIIHIPANTPHQLLLDRGADFRAIVVKVHD